MADAVLTVRAGGALPGGGVYARRVARRHWHHCDPHRRADAGARPRARPGERRQVQRNLRTMMTGALMFAQDHKGHLFGNWSDAGNKDEEKRDFLAGSTGDWTKAAGGDAVALHQGRERLPLPVKKLGRRPDDRQLVHERPFRLQRLPHADGGSGVQYQAGKHLHLQRHREPCRRRARRRWRRTGEGSISA